MRRFACLASFFLGVAWLVGCSSQNAPAPATAEVKGTVTLDGKPMQGGEVRFGVAGQPEKICPITDGKFSGEAYVGKNAIAVVLEKDGPPNPTDPTTKTKVNTVGSNTPQTAEVAKSGLADLKIEAVSAK